MRFLRTKIHGVGSPYEIAGIQTELERRGFIPFDWISSSFVEFTARAAGRLRVNVLLNPFPGNPMLAFGGYVPDATCFPLSLWIRFVPCFFDCWEPWFPRWDSFLKRNRTELAFLSARDAVEHFQRRFSSRRFCWLPESVDPSVYRCDAPLASRSIDVLELGRRHAAFHEQIAPALAGAGMVHRYEKVRGQVIFPTRSDLVSGLADTRISVCFPQSLTNPRRAGRVETATYRYFESMAAKCVLVGKCPPELRDMFGYNPVVEIEEARDVVEIVRKITDHQPLVDRNYQRLLEVGTHSVRVDTLVRELRSAGYSVPAVTPQLECSQR